MNAELNPKLLDVVEFEDSALGTAVKRKGTIVETFGEPPSAVLVETTDSEGVPLSHFTRNIEDVVKVWALGDQSPETKVRGADQYFEEGFLLLQNGLFGRAREHFAKAFSGDPKLAASLLNATNALAQNGKFDAAIRVYELILELQPQYELARQNLAAAHVQKGIQVGRAGLLNQAIEQFSKALMLRPREASMALIRLNLVAAYTQLAIRYSDFKQYQEAVGYFLVAFELSPSDATQRNLAIALVATSASKTEIASQVPDAEFFKQAMQMGLTFSECLNSYGATLAHHGRISEATFALKRAVQVDPRNQLARMNLDTISRTQNPSDLITGLIDLKPQELHLTQN